MVELDMCERNILIGCVVRGAAQRATHLAQDIGCNEVICQQLSRKYKTLLARMWVLRMLLHQALLDITDSAM